MRAALYAALLVPALAGCAGLQVDVDVYKGSLANLQSTQAQQLAAMALGAKPLIIEYRNNLLDDVFKEAGASWAIQYSERARYIPQDKWGSTLTNMQGWHGDARLRRARHLNGILTFYLDLCVDENKTYKKRPADCLSASDADLAGFGNGRQQEGIETLANRASSSAVEPSASPASASERLRSRGFDEPTSSKDARRALERLLVDFAGRVQFFTNNQWLLSDPGERDVLGAERLKTLLETVSNTIMVQADELRREEQHQQNQLKLRAAEHDAAMQLRRPTVELMVDDVRRRIESRLMPSSAASAPVGTIRLDEAQQKSLVDGLAARQKVMVDALTAKVMLSQNLATEKDAVAKLIKYLRVSEKDLQDSHALIRQGVPAGKSTVAEARKVIEQWAAARLKIDSDLHSAVVALKADNLLVSALKSGIAALPPSDDAIAVTRDEAWQQMRSAALVLSNQATANFDQLARVAESQAKSPDDERPQSSRLSASVFAELHSLLKSLREDVIKAVAKRPETGDSKIVTEEFIAALKRKAEADKAAGKRLAEVDAAIGVATALLTDPKPSGRAGPADDALDVLENYIASLRYSYLDAVASGGEGNPDAKNYAEALVQARKQRADMVYVRPSSAYLRSSLAATFAQENPSVQWTNMLNDTIQSLIRANREKPLSKTREDLDKVFWQNINRVRLNAGGLTNYVVAKDDIGNWYVKGMGADPSAMINAAKNLALYNMGGRINANLLRADELRGKLDNDKDASQTQRAAWQTELDKTVKNEGGAGVSVRNGTLGAYQTRYADRTKEHVQDLTAALKAGRYKQSIVERWTSTMGSQPVDPLTAVLTAQENEWAKVVGTTENVSADRRGADVVIDALKALEEFRRSLKKAVLADTALVRGSDRELTAAQQELQVQIPKADQTELDAVASANQVIKTSGALRQAVTDKEPTEKLESLSGLAEQAVLTHQEALQRSASEQSALALAKVKVTSKETALRDASLLRAKAASDVDQVLQAVVRQWVAKRLRAVEELETATKVVGQQTQP